MNIIEVRNREAVRDRIKDFLKSFAEGPEKAVPRPIVAAHVCYDGPDRHFRELYKGLGIASCDGGLYWPRAQDVGEYEAYLINGYGHELAREKIEALYKARPELRPKPVGEQKKLDFEANGAEA
jgi:hypothetical protein